MQRELIDPYGRKIEYVRLSVTDKCNMRCFYCIPKGFTDFAEPEDWLDFDEIERVIAAFSRLGVARIRLTGGEPLVRKKFPQLVSRLAALKGITDLSLSTNAALLADHAEELSQSGIRRINVSLDSLHPDRFHQITKGQLEPVLRGLEAASHYGLKPVKINMVAMKGLNDGEFEDMLEYCMHHGFILRLIETMPVGTTGRDAADYYLPLEQVRQRLQKNYTLVPETVDGGGPASYYRVKGTKQRIGFITPMSQHFCESCNRVRISVEGTLYLCLGQNDKVELRPMLRNGITDQELEQQIINALALKPKRHEFNEQPDQVIRIMSQTGG